MLSGRISDSLSWYYLDYSSCTWYLNHAYLQPLNTVTYTISRCYFDIFCYCVAWWLVSDKFSYICLIFATLAVQYTNSYKIQCVKSKVKLFCASHSVSTNGAEWMRVFVLYCKQFATVIFVWQWLSTSFLWLYLNYIMFNKIAALCSLCYRPCCGWASHVAASAMLTCYWLHEHRGRLTQELYAECIGALCLRTYVCSKVSK